MISKPLEIGFIGGAIDSAIGYTHKIAAQMDGRWRLSAGCFSTNNKINLQTAQLYDVKEDRLYYNWQDLLIAEKDKLDAVVVLTPTPSHAEHVESAIKNGYPVICEKALAVSSEEASRIKNIVHTHQGYLVVTYNYTGYPMLRELQGLIKRDYFGELNQIHIEMPQEGFSRLCKNRTKPTPQPWRLRDNMVSTLSLDLGVHVHHLVKFLTNERPVELVAINNTFGFFDVVDNTMCIARYTKNIDCQIWFGKTALGHSNGLRIRLYGTKGSAEWYQMNPETITTSDNSGRISIIERSSINLQIADESRYNRFKAGHPAGFIEAFANLYYDLADSLMEFKQLGRVTSPWVFGVDDALEGLLMMEAMAKSATNKTWQSISNMRL